MGIYDPDNAHRPQRGGMGHLRIRSVTTWLIILNVAVYVVDLVLKARWLAVQHLPLRLATDPRILAETGLVRYCYFSIAAAFLHLEPWRLLTCQFVHAGFWHLAMNMVGLWIFGELVERRIGRRRYAFFYLLCGIAGPFMYTALWTLGYLTPIGFLPHADTPLVGASAGIFGIMLAAAYLEPDRLVDVIVMDISLKYFAWIMVAIAAYTVFAHGNNAGGQAAHLGGALLGYVLIRHDSALNLVVRRQGRAATRTGRRIADRVKPRPPLRIYSPAVQSGEIMRILVTGGAGFIGSNIAKRLEREGHEVLVLDQYSSGSFTNLVDFTGDVISGDCDREPCARCDVIFHQASITDTTVTDQLQMMRNNVEGFRHVLAWAARWNSRVVWASSRRGLREFARTQQAHRQTAAAECLRLFQARHGTPCPHLG